MKRMLTKVIMAFTVCMFMVLGSIAPAFAVPFSVAQMTGNAADDSAVQISKNGDMVWVGPGINGFTDIFVYDGKTKLTRTLTNSASINNSPQINDTGDIVWRTFNSAESDWNIMQYTKATNLIKRISLPKDPLYMHWDNYPQINNLGQVVYSSQDGGTDVEIMFYDGTSVSRVTNNSNVNDDYPMLNNQGDIAWTAAASAFGSPYDIYLRDGVSKAITPITTTAVNEMNPRINDTGDIVWSGWDGVNYQVYYYKRSTGNTTKLTTNAYDNVDVRLNANGYIAWGQQSTSDQDIFFRNGLAGTSRNVSNNAGKDDGSPSLNDSGWVVWNQDQGTAGTNDQIFVWDGSSVTRITNDAYDHEIPDINSINKIAWQGTGGTGTPSTDYEIFMATTGLCAGVVCNDNNACTTDDCDPAAGQCVYTPIVCNDNSVCTTDTCNTATGACVYTTIVCNDNNACTNNLCNPSTGCYYTTITCTDNSLCTIDTCNTTTGCSYTAVPCNDNNACTTDSCNPATGACVPTPIVCNDNSLCTIDTCNTTTGCVYTSKCVDSNLCTVDTCNPTTGECTYPAKNCSDNNICTTDTCNTTTGKCANTHNSTSCPSTTGNSFTMLDPGNNVVGGTNDVFFAWDGTQKTSVAVSGQVSNALLSSTCTFGGVSWSSHDLAVYGPGTYTVYTGCAAGSPGCGTGATITFTVKTGEIGIHMLFNWDGNLNIDVVNIMKPNAVFAPSPMWTGVCGSNSACTQWGWMSYDYDVDEINGGIMVDGPFQGFSPNFNLIPGSVDVCCDAATRCNDNNACTTDSCIPATGACVNTVLTCNDNNACTTDTCNTATGCVYTPKTCNDSSACTADTCNTSTGACVFTLKTCDDSNACTTNNCNTTTGACYYTPILCGDLDPCTTASCDSAIGCVFPPDPLIDDGNPCTTDTCNSTTGVITHTSCPSGTTCNSTVGCLPSGGVNSTGNNFSLLAVNGYVLGGTNDIKFTWDGTLQNATTFANGNGPSNATISSDEPLSDYLWYARNVQVVGPGTYWVDLDGAGSSTNRYEVTIPTGQIGVHMLFDSGENGQTTSCGKTDCDVDVWMAWEVNKAFATGKLFTGADDGAGSNGPAWDEPYPLPYAIDGRPNAEGKVWSLVSVDLAGRVANAAGTTITNLPLDGIPGIKLREGSYIYSNINFNVMLADPCFDAATRCNDNNFCTTDTCDVATGACGHGTTSCNDGSACTTDTCDPVLGCINTPKSCNDNNACTIDFCNPMTAVCIHPAVSCKDNNICTTDTCNTATGCVFTNNTSACTDNNACTENDRCSGGACLAGTTKTCPLGDVCDPANGCDVSNPNTGGNNFTLLLANGYIMGGTNDVKFSWNGTVQNATTFANGNGPSNAIISSDEPFYSWLWYSKRVQVVGPGTYWVDLDGAGPSTNRFEVTIPSGRLGAHMLLDLGETGQTTSCGKTDCDVDVWIAWDYNNAFMTGKLFTGADDGTNSNAPASDEPYPMPYLVDGMLNASTKVWNLVTVDFAGRITNTTGGTLKDLAVDGIPGIRIQEGTYANTSPSFNVKIQ